MASQLPLKLPPTHGGKRRGAGRPAPIGRRASEPHQARPAIDKHAPLHVVLRAVRGLDLRRAGTFAAIRGALRLTTRIAIVHLSVQRTHVHLIVEASRAHDLARGLQGFQISAARRVNRALGRAGQVFADRYHATPLTSPRQVRNTLAYVLNNWRHHGEDKRPVAALWTKDPFSSATSFDGWREPITPPPATYEPPRVRPPRTWLLTTGWRRYRLIDLAEVPGGSHEE